MYERIVTIRATFERPEERMDTMRYVGLMKTVAAVALLSAATGAAQAQYFQSMPGRAERVVIKADGRDSVIVQRSTPFDLPKLADSVEIYYHEPLPDSIMPKSAVVIGTVQLQAEESEQITKDLEKYARKVGADCIVSFTEPKAVLLKDGWKVYRSTATLLHVLDQDFVPQSQLTYAYYEQHPFTNFASLNDYYQSVGKGLANHQQ
jgi:hypothetical protein